MAKKKSTKPKIEINPANKGKFTKYCKTKGYKGVTKACIQEGKKSPNPKIRKEATFAENARKWKKRKSTKKKS